MNMDIIPATIGICNSMQGANSRKQAIYKKINLDKWCQDICAILKIIAIQIENKYKFDLESNYVRENAE